jgi:hypothetical protein
MGDGASATVGGVSPTVGDSDEGGPEQLGKDHVMAEQGQTMADAAAGGSPAERPGVCECFLCVRVRRSFFWKAYLPIENTLNGKRPRIGP